MLKIINKINKARFHRELMSFRKSELAGKITHIQMEPTAKCNLACITCTRPSELKEYKKLDMSLAELENILRLLPDLKTVKLGGLGEPLYHPDLENFLRTLKLHDLRTWMNTNGTPLVNEKIREIVLKYVDDVAVSFDSTDKETFEKIRIHADMDKIKEGAKLLIKERNEKKARTLIGVNFVVSHMNYEEVGDKLFNFIRDLGVDYVTVTEVENWAVEEEPGYKGSQHFVSITRMLRPEIIKRIKKLRRRLMWHGIAVGHKTSEPRVGKCYWPFNGFFVNNEGFVTSCNIRMHKRYAFGNLFEVNSINEILNNEKYIDFRKSHIEGKPNSICGNCPD